MGASKRVGEMIVKQHRPRNRSTDFFFIGAIRKCFWAAGERYSVIKKQTRKTAGPVTVTHKEVKRYFMTIPEAVALVISGGAIGQEGRSVYSRYGKACQNIRFSFEI